MNDLYSIQRFGCGAVISHFTTGSEQAARGMGLDEQEKAALSRAVGIGAGAAGSSGLKLAEMPQTRFAICCLAQAFPSESIGNWSARRSAGYRPAETTANADLAALDFRGGEGVRRDPRPRSHNTFSREENFHIAHMNTLANLQCPQCLLAHCDDCREPDCPCLSGVPPKKEGGAVMDGASMKILTTMGLRILQLEDLIVRAAGLAPEDEADSAFLEVLREARRIIGKKKEGAV